MKVIYWVGTFEPYEMEWFFDENHNLITYWSCNDAQWREEYMTPLMEALGVEIKYHSYPTAPLKIRKKIKLELKELS